MGGWRVRLAARGGRPMIAMRMGVVTKTGMRFR